MTSIKLNSFRIASTTFTVLLLLAFMLFQGCTRKLAFGISSIVPAAEGSVSVKKDKNDNYKINLDISNLADPSRLSPPKDIYVVWMDTDENGPTNIGQLKSSNHMLSKAMSSSLNTVSSYKPRNFYITAEKNEEIKFPSQQVVLRTGAY